MVRRKLSDEEVKVSEKSIKNNLERIEELNYLIKHRKLMLDEGLQVNYRIQRQKYEKEMSGMKKEINTLQLTNQTARDQIMNGVEEKSEQKEEVAEEKPKEDKK